MRKINCIHTPILDVDDNIIGYGQIKFPETEVSTQSLLDSIDDPTNTIIGKIGTKRDLFGHTEHPNPEFDIKEIMMAKSLKSAIDVYVLTMQSNK